MEVIVAGFAVYAIVLIITMSELFAKPRRWFRMFAYRHDLSPFYAIDASGDPIFGDDAGNQEMTGYDFITCAMCTGVWVAALICLWDMSLRDTVAAYGISYFLKTQERP